MNSPMPMQRPIPGRRLDAIRSVETFIIAVPREVPYLGPLREGEAINERGYLVRKGNRSIYPASDLSVVVKLTGESGTVGWGETYGIAAPEAVKAIIDDLLAPVMRGRDPSAPAPLHDVLYDLMRVRGFTSGYYVDALAGVDIAVWDLFGRLTGLSLVQLVGGRRHERLRAYVSGLPRASLQERCDLAVEWVGKGFSAIKFAAAMSDDGIVKEMAALREAVGPDVTLMVTCTGSSRRRKRSASSPSSSPTTSPSPKHRSSLRTWKVRCALPMRSGPCSRSARSGARLTSTVRVSSGAPWGSCSPRWAAPG